MVVRPVVCYLRGDDHDSFDTVLRHAVEQVPRSFRVQGGGFLGGTDPDGADDRVDTVELRFDRRRVEYVGGDLRQVLVLRP